MTSKPLTGRKVFAITASAFAVIIGVNFFMAWSAVSTFPGLEVGNSYVASQSFDADRAAQEGLGWSAELRYVDNHLVLEITDDDGAPVEVDSLSAILGRSTHVRDDFAPMFQFENGVYRAPAVSLGGGNWNLRFTAVASDGTEFRQRLVLYVRG
ncbi:FixH family protein [Cochlodiniinecator piscidefendens]|uniref:FixH family protein n=1 Tax=Cochlodiniinecator piscidefendens TaxID=2715756 RepID=UPI00140CCEC9|nr:FixH family protein [Cochlodiniinecator piscidefendens]